MAWAMGIVPASNLAGSCRPCRMVPKDLADHVPAAEERVHRLQQRAAAVKDSDARRAVQLVPGERQKVDVQLADVGGQMRDALSPVDEHERPVPWPAWRFPRSGAPSPKRWTCR